MARSCRLVRAGRGVDAVWRRDGDALVVTPAGSAPLVWDLAAVAGIGGDGFTVRLRLPDGDAALERLGGDGPTLLEELGRDWPVLRAGALRLAGGERPAQLFAGTVVTAGARSRFRGFLIRERLILAPEDADVVVHFAADWASVEFVEQDYVVRLAGWDGDAVAFGGMGAASAAFVAAVGAARETLARQAAAVVAAHLPTLAGAGRAALCAEWLPGRLLSFERLESLAPGFEAGFRGAWLASSVRSESGTALMKDVPASERHLAYAAPGADGTPPLWLLARRGDSASLELLSHGDHATYQFKSGPELPKLVEGLVRLPDFSREALYLPLEQLTGDRGAYAIPARELPLLRSLRGRFAGRKIHNSGDSP